MERKTQTINAANRKLGRIATEIANFLIGKHKPDFAPHKDNGDNVVVENPDKVSVTGKKKDLKKYFRHSGYLGGIKEKTFEEIFEKEPEKVIKQAVSGMLPKNKLRAKRLKRLKFKK